MTQTIGFLQPNRETWIQFQPSGLSRGPGLATVGIWRVNESTRTFSHTHIYFLSKNFFQGFFFHAQDLHCLLGSQPPIPQSCLQCILYKTLDFTEPVTWMETQVYLTAKEYIWFTTELYLGRAQVFMAKISYPFPVSIQQATDKGCQNPQPSPRGRWWLLRTSTALKVSNIPSTARSLNMTTWTSHIIWMSSSPCDTWFSVDTRISGLPGVRDCDWPQES